MTLISGAAHIGADREIGERFRHGLNARQLGAYSFVVERLRSLGRAEDPRVDPRSGVMGGNPKSGCRITDDEFFVALGRYATMLDVDEEGAGRP